MKSVTAFAPATVSNVACGFDVLGFALNAPGDEVTASLVASGVCIEDIAGDLDYVLVQKPWAATGQPYPYYQYGIEYDANGARTLDFFFGDTAGQSIGPFSMIPQTGVWTHIAYTYDGALVKGYLDGVLKIQAPATTDIQARGVGLRIGVDGSFQQGFNGRIDDLRIYSRALTQGEVQQDMAQPVVLP